MGQGAGRGGRPPGRALKLDTLLLGSLADASVQAKRFEDLGLDGVFTFEGTGDPFLPLAAAASSTRLDLSTNVALAFTRSPMSVAYTAWDLQRLSEGRFSLGLGTQVRANIERRYASEWRRPVERMREYVLALRAVFARWQHGEPLDVRGDHYSLTLMQPTFDPGPLPCDPPPILLGALGPKMTAMATEVADGLLVHPFATDRSLRELTLPRVEQGLADAGRSRADFEVVVDLIVAAGRTDEELAAATEGTRALVGFYGSTPSYRPPLELHGWGDLQPELNRLSKEGRWSEMTGLVDDEVLDAFVVRGSPTEVGERLVARMDGIADRVGFYLPYAAEPSLVGEVVDGVHAALGRPISRPAGGTG